MPQSIKKTICLVGNPNSGKTTLFNALTGARQRVGNWPGVTVERKSGFFKEGNVQVEVVDLPGVYSLVMASETASLDEKVASDFILNAQADLIVNILDASNLERNLYLTLQLIEMQMPIIVVLNMMDVARSRGWEILKNKLEESLQCAVVMIEAHKKKNVRELRRGVVGGALIPGPSPLVNNTPGEGKSSQALKYEIVNLANELLPHIPDKYHPRANWIATRLLEDDAFAKQLIPQNKMFIVQDAQQKIKEKYNEDADILIADARYQKIQTIMQACVSKTKEISKTWTERLDNIILNRVLGIPIFLAIMYGMFFFAINVGGAFQDFFDIGSNTIFVGGVAELLTTLHAPAWLIALIANGVGKGINTTLTFIPVIGAMFLFLAFLEDSGYMARAAFVIDRVMGALGLPGKSFVPMIVGFGCNVPAVMAARTLENKRDRILTIMMSPFMSCGARLAIYAVFTAAFFPVGGQNIVFALYLIGIVAAMLTGLLLRKTVLQGEPAPLVMELPPYHLPQIKSLVLLAWQRLKNFVFRAGKLIVPICIIVGLLGTLSSHGNILEEGAANSLLASLGKFVTPIFAPMGIHQDNWPATVGLVTGILAKEVVIGTLNALYSQLGHLSVLQSAGFSFWGGLHDALLSVPQNISQLGSSFGNPVLAQAPVHTLSQSIYGLMYKKFDGQIGAMAYLLFVLLYFPCVSTTAAMVRELNRGWAVFSILWTTGIAYAVAVIFYQAATFVRHPISSFMWISGLIIVLLTVIFTMKIYANRHQNSLPLIPSSEVL